MEPEAKRQRLDVTGRRVMKSYKRHNKPPYSYLGMITLIIQTSPGRQQTLAGIINTLMDMFPFFQGEYQGWKDSVRHNLTNSDCFFKMEELVNNVKRMKRCKWAVDFSKFPKDAMVRQDCRKTKEYYAPTLTEHFNLPLLQYIPQGVVLSISNSKLANPPPEHFEDSFKHPRQRVSKSTPRPFSIESILEHSRKSQSSERTFVGHIQFPKTMFDGQTPEKALENLRQLCCSTNPLDAETTTLDKSFEARTSISLSDITNTSSRESTDFPTTRSLSIEGFGNLTPRPEVFTKSICTPHRSLEDSENVTPTNKGLSTPVCAYSFVEPVTPTNETTIESLTPLLDQPSSRRVTSTPDLQWHQPHFTNIYSPRIPAPNTTASPMGSYSFPGSITSPILSPVNFSLSSPSSLGSPSFLFESPAIHTGFGSSYIDCRNQSPQSTCSPYDITRNPPSVFSTTPDSRVPQQIKRHPESFSQGTYFYTTQPSFS